MKSDEERGDRFHGRYIWENINRIVNVVHFCKKQIDRYVH